MGKQGDEHMLTTKEVRKIILTFQPGTSNSVYTNRTAGDDSNNRRVKCYYRSNTALLAALRSAAGPNNVTLTPGSYDWTQGGMMGITVKCVLAD
jgi:hypothetical protein